MSPARPDKGRKGGRSPKRRGDECPHAPACVPCPWRGVRYGEQLARKRGALVEAIAPYPALRNASVEDVIGSRDLFGYRNVAKLSVRAGRDGRLRAGVYEPGSHRLADAAGCTLHHPAIQEVLAATLSEAERLAIPAYDERHGTGELRYLVARYSALERSVLVTLVTRGAEVPGLRDLARRLVQRGRPFGGIVQNVNADPGNVILGRHWATLRPPAELVERIGPWKIRTSPGAFLQANLWTARRIYETVLEWADPTRDELVIDLFCGVGPSSLYLATRAGRVLGIEEVPGAVADARSNARRNGFHNLRFDAGRSEELLPALAAGVGRAGVVTLNPPRKGTTIAVLDAIVRLGPRRIVYVSCNPETLARDLDRLAERGYHTSRLRPFDMLPQTPHVEVVAQLDATEATR